MSRKRSQSYRHLLNLYATLSQVNQAILRVSDAEDLYRRICRIATEYGHFRFVWIGLADPVRREIVPVAWSGEGSSYLKEIRIQLDPDHPEGQGPAARAFFTGKMQVVHDFFNDPRTAPWVPAARRHGFRSSIGVAISRGRQNVGVLSIYASEKSFFGQSEQQLIREMALDIGFALDYFDNDQRRKKAETALVKSRQNLSRLLESSLSANRTHEPAEIMREFSRTALSLTGGIRIAYTLFEQNKVRYETLGENGWHETTPDDALSGGDRSDRRTLRSPAPDGKNDLVRLPVFGIKDQALGFMDIVCPQDEDSRNMDMAILSTLTAQAAVTLENAFLVQALSLSETRLRVFQRTFESSTASLCICDALQPDFPIVFANDQFLRLTGYTRKETLGKNCRFLQGADREQESQAEIRRALDAGKSVRTILRNYRKDGSLFINDLSLFPILDTDGQITHYLGIQNDITDTLTLEKNREIASLVFDMASDGILLTDSENRIVLVNRAFTEITGYTQEEAQGKDPRILSSGRQDSFFYQAMWHELRTAGTWQGELWNRRKSGEVYPEWLSISTRKDQNGRIENFIGIFHDLTGVKESEERIAFLAYHDPLTGLPNRILLRDRLEYAILQTNRRNRELAILLLDLDGFKNVNDLWGHHVGDRLLVEVSRRMAGAVRTSDSVGRMGGDEFLILFPDLQSLDELSSIMTRLLDQIRLPFEIEGQSVNISASGGVTLFPRDAAGVDDLIRHADIAMYSAKNRGKNRIHFYELSMEQTLRNREALKQELSRALEGEDLHLLYQPQIDIRTGAIIGAEALLRWFHPDGIRLPGEFLGSIENDDLSIELGRWVLRKAFEQHLHWRKKGHFLRIGVNISPRHFNSGALEQDLEHLLQKTGTGDLSGLELEITENTLISDLEEVRKTVQACRTLGIHIAFDDFGTGYTSLTMVRTLRPDTLKVDQSFLRGIAENPGNRSILESILKIGQGFGENVIMEGVENPEEFQLVREIGYRYIQGFLVSRPILPDRFDLFLREWQSGRPLARLLDRTD
ncbi:MAG: EAL domain-containing protein [Nitrospirae bacterium]|nr:EAL domain-containing protein [Nitrospirota bacterium]